MNDKEKIYIDVMFNFHPICSNGFKNNIVFLEMKYTVPWNNNLKIINKKIYKNIRINIFIHLKINLIQTRFLIPII